MRQFRIAPAYMQSHPFTRDILYCPVDDGTDLLDEPDERGNRPVLESEVALKCEIGSQINTVIKDGHVFDVSKLKSQQARKFPS